MIKPSSLRPVVHSISGMQTPKLAETEGKLVVEARTPLVEKFGAPSKYPEKEKKRGMQLYSTKHKSTQIL